MDLLTRVISRGLVYSGFAEICSRKRTAGQDPSITILAYHRIGDVQSTAEPLDEKIISASPAGFDWQIGYLKSHFTVLAFDDVLDHIRQGRQLPPDAALITFDDGYRDNYDLAFPILRRHNMPAAIFLVTSLIDTMRSMWWDEVAHLTRTARVENLSVPGLGSLPLKTPSNRLGAREKLRRYIKILPGDRRVDFLNTLWQQVSPAGNPALSDRVFMTWGEVREMRAGGISFGAHTHSHPILTRVSLEQAECEIALSKQAVEDALGQPARLFAYPNGRAGDFNNATRSILARLGFEAAVTLVHGHNNYANASAHARPLDWLALRRIYIGSDDRAAFVAKVSGALDKLSQFARINQQGEAGG